jgi:type II/III secretion system protein
MTRRIAVSLFLALALCGAAFADDADKGLSVRPFQFKHKEADKAAAIIKPLLSPEGTMNIQPATNTLVITDHPDNLKAIVSALGQYDTEPVAVQLSVRLVSAGRVEGVARVPEELKDVAAKLRMLRYNSLENLGSATVDTREGQSGMIELQSGYRADFRVGEFDPVTKSVQIIDFKLSRVQKDQLADVLKTTLNLKVGVTHILAATKSAGSDRAVMLVVTAKH